MTYTQYWLNNKHYYQELACKARAKGKVCAATVYEANAAIADTVLTKLNNK